jgi:hypothetical protein
LKQQLRKLPMAGKSFNPAFPRVKFSSDAQTSSFQSIAYSRRFLFVDLFHPRSSKDVKSLVLKHLDHVILWAISMSTNYKGEAHLNLTGRSARSNEPSSLKAVDADTLVNSRIWRVKTTLLVSCDMLIHHHGPSSTQQREQESDEDFE